MTVCATDILSKLDDCKPDDLACECCALQSMNQNCFGLCRNSPSANFLDLLINDCSTLSEVNACGLPFKKADIAVAKVSRTRYGSRKSPTAIQEHVKSIVSLTQENKTAAGNTIRVSTKSRVPGPIVLSSRIKNNSSDVTEEPPIVSVTNTSVNATKFEVSNAIRLAPCLRTISLLLLAIIFTALS